MRTLAAFQSTKVRRWWERPRAGMRSTTVNLYKYPKVSPTKAGIHSPIKLVIYTYIHCIYIYIYTQYINNSDFISSNSTNFIIRKGNFTNKAADRSSNSWACQSWGEQGWGRGWCPPLIPWQVEKQNRRLFFHVRPAVHSNWKYMFFYSNPNCSVHSISVYIYIYLYIYI